MILKKPYAFLIKNFKRIHFILFILNAFLSYYVYKTYKFFLDYQKIGKTFFKDDLVIEYIKPSMFILIGLCILVLITIVVLLNQKQKPIKLYIIMISYYVILIVFLLLNAKYLNVLQFDGLEPKLVRMFKDLNFLSLFIQVIFSLILLIRAVGFDIKKFDFGTDIVALEIDVSDDEEVELTTGIDIDDVSGKSRKRLRELKYFYAENKSVLIGGIILVILAFSILFYTKIISNETYKEGMIIPFYRSELKINKSYITKLDYKGQTISPKGYSYIIIEFDVKGIYTEPKEMSTDNFRLNANNNNYHITTRKYKNFTDMGVGYIDQKIPTGETKTYIIVFEVKEEDIKEDIILKYADSKTIKGSKVIINYKDIKINPNDIDKVNDFGPFSLNSQSYFGYSFLKESHLTINNIELSNRFEYEVNNNKIPFSSALNNTIIKLEYLFDLDEELTYISNFKDLINEHGFISYNDGENISKLSFVDITPEKYVGNAVFLEVSNKIKESDNIFLIITIRNCRYTYKLK